MDPNAICISFDVEWACDAVIDDTRTLLAEAGITGTFFVTHAGVSVPGHERALHPNFRRDGDIYRALPNAAGATDAEVFDHVVATALTFAPEAKGVRAHSLFFDSTLLPIYAKHGLTYDTSYRLELVPGLRPFWKQHGIVEIPTYYADYFDLVSATTGFDIEGLNLAQPGMKVFDFHPNLIYTNAISADAYQATKAFYRDTDRLLAAREKGTGTRSLFVALLDAIVARKLPTATLGEVDAWWRAANPPRA